MNKQQFWKLVLALCGGIYFLACAANPAEWHFIDGVNLIIHEAGHVIFSPFGQFMQVLGGSLNQVLIPLIFAGYFFLHRQYYSGSLVLFWVGENLLNISVYAGDAIRMQLPLLGGDASLHDWNWLLFYTGLLHQTHAVALSIQITGTAFIVAATLLAIKFSFSAPETPYET